MPATPVTPAEFGALVDDLRAELAVTEGLRRREFFTVPRRAAPDAFKGRPWVRQHMGVNEVADLTGMTAGSIMDLDRRARQARSEGKARGRRLMPPSEIVGAERRWMIGEVALFIAAGSDRRPPRPARKPAEPPGVPRLPSPGDEELLEIIRRAVKTYGIGVTRQQVMDMARSEGIGARSQRIAPMLMRARIEYIRDATQPTDGLHGGELESLRRDGLVTTTQVGAAFGVSLGAITHAVERRRLTPVKYEPGPLFDPQQLAVRADGTKGPVDKSSELAADMDAELTGEEQK